MIVFSIENLYKKMGGKQVLNGVNLSIEKGEVLGLVGRSGSGKTVLIKTIIGFLKPDKGQIKINSKSNYPIGYSMQENAIYENLTVLQNLRYFASINRIKWRIKRQRIRELIKSMDLGEYKRKLVKNISGGTKKRVDLACALLGDPDIVVLDEPLLGLDPGLVDSILGIIKKIEKQGKTVIISSHQIAELSRVCSRFVLLKDGIMYKIKQKQLGTVYI
jgi:ABC-2 type transport system ATP-binding protein